MTAADLISRRGRALTAVTAALSGLLLAGCNVQAHDPIDTKAPTGVPVPAAMQPAAKPAAPVVPPPTEAELGMPIYPGAKTYVDDTGAPVAFQSSGGMATAMLETPDSVDQVVDFYKSKMTAAAASGVKPVEPHEEKVDGRRKIVMTGNDTEGNVQMAQVREDNNKTVIELMRTQVKTLPGGVSGGAPDNIISGSLAPSASSSSSSLPTSSSPSSSSAGTPASGLPSSSGAPASSGAGGASAGGRTP